MFSDLISRRQIYRYLNQKDGFKTHCRLVYLSELLFAYLDGDFYDSILISLQYVYPKLTAGAVCLIDDYCDPQINPKGWNRLPGVKKACDEYLRDKPEKIEFIYSGPYSHGFFRKAGVSKPKSAWRTSSVRHLESSFN